MKINATVWLVWSGPPEEARLESVHGSEESARREVWLDEWIESFSVQGIEDFEEVAT